jgi:hypothetical protein
MIENNKRRVYITRQKESYQRSYLNYETSSARESRSLQNCRATDVDDDDDVSL